MQEKAKRTRREDNKSTPISKIMIGAVLGSILYFAFLAFFALFALKSNVSVSSYMPAGMVLGALTAFIGGFVAVKPLKQKGAVFGALTGLVQALICSIILFVVNEAAAGTGIFILMALLIAAAAGGGIAAVNMKTKRKY